MTAREAGILGEDYLSIEVQPDKSEFIKLSETISSDVLSKKNGEKIVIMVELELLNSLNRKRLLDIDRTDIPKHYVEDVAYTISLSDYGKQNNLKGFCYAIKCDEQYVGIILIGEAIPSQFDPDEVKNRTYFRIIGFVIDKNYRHRGIGSIALDYAINNVYLQYGTVPILLECHCDNANAIRFYEAHGFRNTGILHEDNYYYLR